MRILLTNDDGIHAEGLAALESIARALSDDVWICAPETERSGASRSLTLAEPIRVRRLEARRFAVQGTPTDCILLAVQDLIEGPNPDLVLSGVNRGLNAAEDVTLSGTVAGAIEGMALGIRSIALSQVVGNYRGDERADFAVSEQFGPGLIGRLLDVGWPPDAILNVNFPVGPPAAVTGVEATRQGMRDAHARFAERRTDLRGREYYWLGFRQVPPRSDPGTDLHAAQEGRISVTPLHINLTHMSALHALRGAIGGAPPTTKNRRGALVP
jgi:5'-nucleotidase